MGIKSSIKIYDLYPDGDVQFFQETTPWEMSNIMGGFGRRRRNRNPSNIDNNEISGLMENINTSLDRLRTDVDTTLDELRQAISF